MENVDNFLKELKYAVIVKRNCDLGEPYDLAIIPAIGQLKAEISKKHQEGQSLAIKRQQAILNGLPQSVIEDLDEFSGDLVDTEILLNQQLAVIAEMRLAFFYKSFEIELKKILQAAFHVNSNKISTAEKQNDFLISKGISMSDLNGFSAIEQLRVVVNNIKHGTAISNKVRKIDEFESAKYLSYERATKFYYRIAPGVNELIENISEQVFKSLYLDQTQ